MLNIWRPEIPQEHAVDITRGTGFVDVALAPDFLNKLPKAVDLEKETLYSLFAASIEKNATRNCLGWRPQQDDGSFGPYKWMDYAEYGRRSTALANGFVHYGAKKGDRVTILAINSPEWHMTEFAAARQGLVTVPLYTTFGIPALAYILRQSRAVIAVVMAEQLRSLLEACERAIADEGGEPALKRAVVFSPAPGWVLEDEDRAAAAKVGLELVTFDEVMSIGQREPAQPNPPLPDDLWSIIYTSGTTGDPKGVIHVHRSIVAATEAILHFRGIDGSNGTPTHDQVHISFLPLAHVFERQFSLAMLRAGASVGYYCGSIPKLFDDIATLRPTYIAAVPRVWKKLRDKVMESIDNGSFVRRSLFYWAYNAKTEYEEGRSWQLLPWDRILFSRMAAGLGGRCVQLVSGGAAGSPELAAWLARCFLVHVFNGYGMTETAGGSIIQEPPYSQVRTPASIGFPVFLAQLRLVDAPDLGYRTSDDQPSGELCICSPAVFQGYLHDDARTAEAFLEPRDGDNGRRWLRTGDIGRLNEDGSVTIVDRVKNMFKLSQGEYVAAEMLETIFSRSPLISQLWIHGEPTETFVIAIVVPNEDEILRVASDRFGVPKGTKLVEVCKRQDVTDFVLSEINTMARSSKMPGFQIPKALLLEPEQFSTENNLLSLTFKLRRPMLRARYAKEIQDLCKKGRAAVDAASTIPKHL